MTLDTKVKKTVKKRYPQAFEYRQDIRCPVLAADLMQYFKGGIVPTYIQYQHQLIDYFVRKIFDLLSMTNQLVICVDKESPTVKKIVCHGARKERRCKLCKDIEVPPAKTQPRSQFHPECSSKCFEKQILHHEDGPFLPTDNETPILFLDDWMRFALDSRNLRYELYPRIINALLSCTLPHGKMLFLNGFPLKIHKSTDWTPDSVMTPDGYHMTVQYWEYADLPLQNPGEDMFCHTLKIFDGNRRTLCPDMYNTIPEADNSIFFFMQFFPQHYQHTVFINDGDAISIGLLLAQEYARGVDEQGRRTQKHELILMMPNLADTFVKDRFEFVNLTTLHNAICDAQEFKNVQNPVATFVFSIILTETDFFQGFCHGIGLFTKWDPDETKREKQTKGIWDTLYDELDEFSHLVQFYRGEPSVTEPRRIVLDQDLFRVFVERCYVNKYGKNKKLKRSESGLAEIRIHCNSNIKDKKRHPPTDEIILRWCRQIDYNINYLINEPRNVHLDPFETYLGLPYYGYADNRVVDIVAAKQKPVDEVYKRHFLKRKQKKSKTNFVVVPETEKQTALNKLKGFY